MGTILGFPSIISLTLDRITVMLMCTSSNGPATTVSWKKNSIVLDLEGLDYRHSQRLVDTETATYESYLRSSNLSMLVGGFTCTVSNNRGAAEKTLQFEGNYCIHV